MKVTFKSSFLRDLRKLRDKALKTRVKETIEFVEQAQNLQEAGNIKKLRGGDRCYRIRIGDYRNCTLKAPEFIRGDEKVLASKTQMVY